MIRTRCPTPRGRRATTRFLDPRNTGPDGHVTIDTRKPGAAVPFPEAHVMEQRLYLLQGKRAGRPNRNWVALEVVDVMWLRTRCPRACNASGPPPLRNLLYKDANRHAALDLGPPRKTGGRLLPPFVERR